MNCMVIGVYGKNNKTVTLGFWNRKFPEAEKIIRVINLLNYMHYVCVCVSHSVMPNSLWPHGLAHQAPLPIEFSRQQYWSGLPFSTPKYLPDPGIKPMSLMTPALAGGFFITVPPITKEQTQIQAEVDPDSCDIKGLTLWVHKKCSHLGGNAKYRWAQDWAISLTMDVIKTVALVSSLSTY